MRNGRGVGVRNGGKEGEAIWRREMKRKREDMWRGSRRQKSGKRERKNQKDGENRQRLTR